MTTVRPIHPRDKLDWLRMRQTLWPEDGPVHELEIDRFFRGELVEPEAVFVAESDGRVTGFAEFAVRAYAEGCVSDRVGYLEGIYVDEDARCKGIGRALVEAGEDWARGRGCVEFASDAEADDNLSARVHARLGFTEVGLIRCFRKALDPDTD